MGGNGKRIGDGLRLVAARLYRDGMGIDAIGERIERPAATVRAAMVREGLAPWVAVAASVRGAQALDRVVRVLRHPDHRQGLTYAEIGDCTGYAVPSIVHVTRVGMEHRAVDRAGWVVSDGQSRALWRATEDPPSITCPVCGWTSYNPNDIREGYCGRCARWTSEPTG